MKKVQVILKKGRDRPVLHGHPWIFSGAIDRVDGDGEPGDIAEVLSADGTWLARGLLHPDVALAVRLYTRRQDEPIDAALFARRIDAALDLRKQLFPTDAETNAWRWVYSESDGISGLIVDRYADVLAVQVNARCLLAYLEGMMKHLSERTGLTKIHVRSDDETLEREKFDASTLPSSFVPELPVLIRENNLQFKVDLRSGQKTGFFCDQRVNRTRVAAYAKGRRVLSAYCYTGAFEVYAAASGAPSIIGVDRSESALELARDHHRLNGTTTAIEYLKEDVPDALRRFRDRGEMFDLIILDPPRFVFNAAQKTKGMRAYKDINLLAMKLLTPGGILATFSCSGLVSRDDFMTVIGWAAGDAGCSVQILEQLGQPPDHPISAVFPESDYLKGFICHVGRP